MKHNLVVLVADDEKAIRRYLRTSLEDQGYVVYEAQTGSDALQELIHKRPDMMILDIGLPDMDGVEVTRKLREWSDIPVLILSVRDQEQTKIAALDAGADDYLTKPFSAGELMARMRAAMRRITASSHESIFKTGPLEIDLGKRIVTMANQEVSLTPTEYDLLRILAHDAGKVLTHRHIINALWGDYLHTEPHLLRVNISNLRKKLEENPSRPKLIITEPGVGYRLKLQEE